VIPGVHQFLNLALQLSIPEAYGPTIPPPSILPSWEQDACNLVGQLADPLIPAPKVFFVGDSISFGWPWWDPVNLVQKQGKWDTLFPGLGGWTAFDLAIGGSLSINCQYQLNLIAANSAALAKLRQVEFAVVEVGTNDVQAKVSNDVIAVRTMILVSTLLNLHPSLKVLLYGIFPRTGEVGGESAADANVRISAINRDVSRIPGLETASLRYRDLFSELDDPDLFRDGIHPNDEGYKVWAGSIAESLLQPW